MCFSLSDINEALYQRILYKSYKPNDQLSIQDLCYLTIRYYDFHHQVTTGELIVNKKIGQHTLHVFEELYQIEYPIEKVKLIDEYNGDDYLSMSDNNSSAFNYRYIDRTTILSNHSFGTAIDINPLYNPYIKTVDGQLRILPPEGKPYMDRGCNNPYMIHKNDCCYEIFRKYGFQWGGDWTHAKDYQHFEYID